MSAKLIYSRRFLWEGIHISARGGDLRKLFRSSPFEVWNNFKDDHPPEIVDQVKHKIRSCLTEICVGYLQEAKAIFLILPNEYSSRLSSWKSCSDWKTLEGQYGHSHSRDDCGKMNVNMVPISNHRVAKLHSGENGATDRSAGAIPFQMVSAQQIDSNKSGNTQRPLWIHDSTGISCRMLDEKIKSNAEWQANFAASSRSDVTKTSGATNGITLKRGADCLDHEHEVDKKRQFLGKPQVTLPLRPTSEPTQAISQQLLTQAQSLPSNHANPASAYHSLTVLTPPILNMSTNDKTKIAACQASTLETNNSRPATTQQAVPSLPNLSSEESAEFWLRYHLPSILEDHRPTKPTDPVTGNAVECARPYLLSLKSKLGFLATTAQSIAKGGTFTTLGLISDDPLINRSSDGTSTPSILAEQLESALKDLNTAWDCLAIVKANTSAADCGSDDVVASCSEAAWSG